MILSELIKELQAKLDIEGDMLVGLGDGSDACEVDVRIRYAAAADKGYPYNYSRVQGMRYPQPILVLE